MVVIRNNNITSCDVDNTLVMWFKDSHKKRKGCIEFDFGGDKIYLRLNKSHIRFLKHCYNRGDYIEVWSQNGFQWAEQVVLKLGLKPFVHTARAKTNRHIDDKTDVRDIIGNRIYLGEE